MLRLFKLFILTLIGFFMLGVTMPVVSTAAEEASGGFSGAVSDGDGQKLIDRINSVITLLSALTAIAITGSIIFAGIQYSTSGGNPQASAAAKKRITQAITALVTLVFMYSFLQWLVPGGIF